MPVPRRASQKAPPGGGGSGCATTARNKGSELASLCTWTPLTPSSDQEAQESQVLRNKHSTVAYKGMVVVFGGHDLHANRFLDDVIVYDTRAERWFTPPCVGQTPCPRRAHSAALLGNVMIICGGFAGNGCSNDAAALDLDTWTWSRLKVESASVPCPRGGHSAAVHDGVMYIHGGWDTTPAYHSDVWSFRCDLAKGTCCWEPVKVQSQFVPPGRVGHRAVIVGREMIVTGGFGDDKYWNDVNALDLHTSKWRSVAPAEPSPRPGIPRPRTYHSMEAKDGKLLVVGGSDHSGEMPDVWLFDMATCRWKEVHCGGLKEGRFAHTSCAVGTNVLIFGGISVSSREHSGRYEESTDLVMLRVEDWAADNTLLHTLRRLVVQSPEVLTGTSQCMPRAVVDSLLSYVDRFTPEALPQQASLRKTLTEPPPSVPEPLLPLEDISPPSPPVSSPDFTPQDLPPLLPPHLRFGQNPASMFAAVVPAAGRPPADPTAEAEWEEDGPVPLSPRSEGAIETVPSAASPLSAATQPAVFDPTRCGSASGGSSRTLQAVSGVRSGSGSSEDAGLPPVVPNVAHAFAHAFFPATRPASRSGSASSLGDGSVGPTDSVPSRSTSGESAASAGLLCFPGLALLNDAASRRVGSVVGRQEGEGRKGFIRRLPARTPPSPPALRTQSASADSPPRPASRRWLSSHARARARSLLSPAQGHVSPPPRAAPAPGLSAPSPPPRNRLGAFPRHRS